MSQNGLMWIKKYRPKTLNEVVNQKDAIDGIKALLKTPATMPHPLLSAPPVTTRTVLFLPTLRY
jgi:replication factor C small subunit